VAIKAVMVKAAARAAAIKAAMAIKVATATTKLG
jgi:hypothetical protein